MSSLIETEEVMTLTELAAKLPKLNGRRPHVASLWRWARRGSRGVKLESVWIGGRLVSSLPAFVRFTERLAQVRESGNGNGHRGADTARPRERSIGRRTRSAKQRIKDVERAKKELRDAGIRC